jgi:flagellar biosynthesis/type III secretory pathway protein FliH
MGFEPDYRAEYGLDKEYEEGYAAGKREAKVEIKSLKSEIKKLEKEIKKLEKKK